MKTLFTSILAFMTVFSIKAQIPTSAYTISPAINGKPHFVGGKISLNTTTIANKIYIEDNTPGGDSPDSRVFAVFKNTNSSSTVSQQFAVGNDGFLEIGYLGSQYGGFGTTLNSIYANFSTIQARGGSNGLILRADAPYYGSNQGIIKFLAGYGNYGAPERMRIDGNGNVGIGTQSPTSKLHIQNGNLTVSSGDLVISQIYTGIILKSPSSICYKIMVADNGSLTTIQVSCPY
jgi:hypothetical protein